MIKYYFIIPGLLGLIIFTSCKSEISKDLNSKSQNVAHGFELTNLNGNKKFSLSDFNGKPVVLNFWATWCSPCREEMPFLQETWTEYKDDGIVFIGINVMDDPSNASEFLSSLNIDYLNLSDKSGSVSGKYGVVALPATFFIDKKGNIHKQNYGPFLGESGEKLFIDYTEEILK